MTQKIMHAGDGIHASYGEAFAAFAGSLPAAEHAARAAAFDEFIQHGFPDDAIERWHYTNLSTLPKQAVRLAAAAALDTAPWQLGDCDEFIWINGEPQGAATDAAGLPAPDAHAGLAGLHRAFARPGLQLALGAGEQRERPVHALTISTAAEAGEMTHLAHRISLARGAKVTVILQNVGTDGAARFITQSLAADLADGAQLTLIRLQDESRATTQWLQTDVNVGRDARFELINVDFGGKLIRNDWRVKLLAPGAQTELAGLFGSDARAHLDNQYEIDHVAAHGTSRQFFRGLGFGNSKTVLNGRVVVQRGAQKTDSEQSIANLMLAKGAEIDAKPELEIYADDVKCAHGATCGQLDDTAVFYLRTRGVPEATARALLTYSFANDVIARIAHAGLRERIARRITAALGAELDLDALSFEDETVDATGDAL
ncbi:Fe-S cluster assembly protein SufD [Solimonas marina]|uniref:Fe-S cluster assembly protein SufD n=1 Tax=Solimonas marina TaxID=2714601 RepID=A0A969WCJ2_9GAMM|nr:Fe-S cluster assembly protein SufD [Solimonas marina]NKF24447.1 Fe-S cluster assembly protein SufD [Solimonas marina]